MAQNNCHSSGRKTADVTIMAQPGKLMALSVEADGTNAATVILYDNATAASGNELAKIVVDAGLTEASIVFNHPVEALNGIYADLTGTGAACIVYYELG